jgi:hypothetical protein
VTVQQPTPGLIAHFGSAASCVNLFAPPIGVRVTFMRPYAGQYSKPRHSAIGRKLESCDRHDYHLGLSAEREQRESSDRFGRYRLSERFVGYNKKWFGHQAI